MEKKMFCYQCEQTAGCQGCTGNIGVCGKKASTAELQASALTTQASQSIWNRSGRPMC